MLLLLEDNDDSRRAMGKYLDAWQYPDGRVGFRIHSAVLPYFAYDRLSEAIKSLSNVSGHEADIRLADVTIIAFHCCRLVS
ncbi:hypothetical protein IN13_14355 [Salmonella enterica]|nr:hypothetical protein IN13_14355 [Salmonella enterica]